MRFQAHRSRRGSSIQHIAKSPFLHLTFRTTSSASFLFPPARLRLAQGRKCIALLHSVAAASCAYEPTLEDIVREALRPMLKSWLDENLPRVVERMVQAEVERVARGR